MEPMINSVQRLKRKESAEKNIPVGLVKESTLRKFFENRLSLGWRICLGWNNRKWRYFCNEGSPGNSPRLLLEDDEVVAVASEEHLL